MDRYKLPPPYTEKLMLCNAIARDGTKITIWVLPENECFCLNIDGSEVFRSESIERILNLFHRLVDTSLRDDIAHSA